MKKIIRIGDQCVGEGHRPFIVAELSGNHNGSLDKALKLVDIAIDCGVDAIKLQTYTADTLTIDCDADDFYLSDPASLWHGQTMYELYAEAYTPWDWHKPIFERCREKGVICFSSAFDPSAVDFLQQLDAPCFKIGSTENTDTELLEVVAQSGKPVIVSVGMMTIEEIGMLLDIFKKYGNPNLILLKCNAAYPAEASAANLITIPHLAKLTGCPVGLSDHSMGIGVAVGSVTLGSCVIEKHFTLLRSEGGVDAEFSMEPKEMRELVQESRKAWEGIGQITYGESHGENSSMSRRSLYIVEDMKAGEVLNEKNCRSIRPGYGLPSRYKRIVMGMKINSAVKRGTRLSWSLLK